MVLQLVRRASPEVFAASRAVCDLLALVHVGSSILVVEGCLALLAEEPQGVDRVIDEPLRRGHIEVLSAFRAVLVLFVPFNDACATEEGLAVPTYNEVFGNVEADVALELLSKLRLLSMRGVQSLELLRMPCLPNLLLDLGLHLCDVCGGICERFLDLMVLFRFCFVRQV